MARWCPKDRFTADQIDYVGKKLQKNLLSPLAQSCKANIDLHSSSDMMGGYYMACCITIGIPCYRCIARYTS